MDDRHFIAGFNGLFKEFSIISYNHSAECRSRFSLCCYLFTWPTIRLLIKLIFKVVRPDCTQVGPPK